MIVHAITKENEYFLIQNSSIIFLTNGFTPAILALLNFGYWISKYYRTKIMSPDSTKILTQKQMNKMFLDPIFNVPQNYANLLKTMLFSCAFSCLIPIGPLITIIGLFCQYWSEKVNNNE